MEVLNAAIEAKKPISSNLTWCLANLCRDQPHPPYNLVSPLIKVFTYILKNDLASHDKVTDSMWALYYLSLGNSDKIKAILDADILDELAECLKTNENSILVPTLRVLGNTVKGT